ncbi:hypothetical protein ACU4GR_24110 [Methylobacterium oryzae CBMB20]
MNDDMKRLCDAAEAVISGFGEDLAPGSLAREVVRAVLIELRKTAPETGSAGGDHEAGGAVGAADSHSGIGARPAGMAFTATIDRLLAEPLAGHAAQEPPAAAV